MYVLLFESASLSVSAIGDGRPRNAGYRDGTDPATVPSIAELYVSSVRDAVSSHQNPEGGTVHDKDNALPIGASRFPPDMYL